MDDKNLFPKFQQCGADTGRVEPKISKEGEQQMETINQYIDMNIVQFTERITAEKSFSEANAMNQLMDMEYSRLLQVRAQISKGFADVKTKSKEFEALFTRYIGTFVLEQKLIDRKAILEHIMKLKGVRDIMTAVAPKSSVAGTSMDSERTSTAKTNTSVERMNSSKKTQN